MERKITQALVTWRESARRKPLVILGARQVGKTHTLKAFAETHFENCAYFDLERQTAVAAIFEGDLTASRLVGQLALVSGQEIEPDRTLIVLDEVQGAERGLTALKYLREQAPEYHVVAAGSVLGLALARKHVPYPVGQVETLTMGPLDFEEFLWAVGERPAAAALPEYFESSAKFPLHERLLDWYRSYLVAGGMPEATAAFAASGDLDAPSAVHAELDSAYVADMARYADPSELVRIMRVWDALPAQLAKPNRKFQYALLGKGARSSRYTTALAWLDAAHLVYRCEQATSAATPLVASVNPDSFKLYLLDVGLLGSKFQVRPQDVRLGRVESPAVRGAMAESFVAQQLVAGGAAPHYWGVNGKAEVDFLLTDQANRVVPVEVKSSDRTRSRSLTVFAQKYHPSYAIRLSTKNFGSDGFIRSVPLYAAHLLAPGPDMPGQAQC